MLVSPAQHYLANTLVTFKLINGDEILGRVSQETDAFYQLDRACSVVAAQKGIMLIACLFTADTAEQIVISKSHVLFHAPTARSVMAHYVETTTGIKSQTSSLITL